MVAVWRSGNGVGRINKVTLRRARLVLGWVTISGGQTTSVCNHPPIANSTSYPQRDGKWVPAKVRWRRDALWLGSKGRHGSFHLLIHVCVADITVWSLVNMCHTLHYFWLDVRGLICPSFGHSVRVDFIAFFIFVYLRPNSITLSSSRSSSRAGLPPGSELLATSSLAGGRPSATVTSCEPTATRFELSRHVEIARTYLQQVGNQVCDLHLLSCYPKSSYIVPDTAPACVK